MKVVGSFTVRLAQALTLSLLACGKVATGGRTAGDASGGNDAGGRAAEDDGLASSGRMGGAPGSGGASSDAPASGGACSDPASGLAGSPGAVGCYAHESGGWRKVPCNCELDVANVLPGAATVNVTLSLDGSVTPSLTGTPDVEVTFDDPDSSWFSIWSREASKAGGFAVSHDATATTVRLGAARVVLDAVPLAGCDHRQGTAKNSGTGQTLTLQATFIGGAGTTLPAATNTCSDLPHP